MQSKVTGSSLHRFAAVAAFFAAMASGAPSARADVRYVGAESGDYTTVADAIAAAADNDEVVIRTGTYALAAEIVLARPLTIRGATGKPEDVTLTMQSSGHRHFTVDAAGAVLSGLTLANATESNNSRISGGSVLIKSQGGTVSNCVFSGNSITTWAGRGGAVYMDSADALVTHCFFTGNTSANVDTDNGGNAIGMTAGTVRNCLFVGNGLASRIPGRCGTVYMTGGTVENCTFANNADGKCAGVSVNGRNAAVRNCVFYGADCPNASSELVKIMNNTAYAGSFINCCAPVAINDTCLVSGQPFADARHGDWTPAATIVDRGLSLDWMTGAADLAGNPRICGDCPDIGCYELDQSLFSASVEPSATSGIGPFEVTFSVTAYGTGMGGITCYWDWDGNGTWDDTTDGSAVHVYATGAHSTRVKVVDNATQEEYEPVWPIALTVVPRTIYVDCNSTEPVSPFDDPEHAATNLADAYAVALDGCEIVICTGNYSLASMIEVTKGVTMRSQTGNPSDVTLSVASGVKRRHFILNHSESALFGLTLANATEANTSRESGGSVLIRPSGGTISNCVFSGNSITAWAGSGGAIYMDSSVALITHCVFTGNRCANTDTAAGGNAISLTGGQVRNCLFVGNGDSGYIPGKCGTVYMTGGTVENCTFANNADGKCAGVSVNGNNAAVRNCVFYGADCPKADSELGKILYNTTHANKFSNCCAPIAINDTCLAAAEPFADAARGDWTPAAVLVDKALTLDWMTEAADLAGNPRISGTAPDIGCYEKDLSRFGASVEASATSGIGPFEVTFTVTTFGTVAEGVTCHWDWDGDGSWDTTTEGSTAHIYAIGAHTTKVKVVDNATRQEIEPTSPFVLTVVPKTLYVDVGSTEPVSPFDDPEHAAAAVSDACAVALDGCEIVIATGTYGFDSTVEVLKGVTLRSKTGNPNDVILTMNEAGHRHFILNSARCGLYGLTLANATEANTSREHGGSVQIRSFGATISNCVFTANTITSWAGQGGAVYMGSANALVTHCVFTGNCSANTDTDNGGNAIGMTAGTVRNCLFVGNGFSGRISGRCGTVYMTGGTVENCTFANNADGKCAGVSVNNANATVRNCIFYGADCPKAESELVKIVNYTAHAGRFFNCLAPVSVGTNCVVTDDPKFKNAAGGNCRLKADSPAIDKGALCDWMDGATDLRGNPRKVQEGPDIGCYEYPFGGLRLFIR